MKKLKVENVMNQIEQKEKQLKKELDFVKKIESIISKFDGKKITKRICTAVKKEFEGIDNLTIAYNHYVGMFYIECWGDYLNFAYNERMSILLGYDNVEKGIFNLKKFRDYNTYFYYHEERLEQLEQLENKKKDIERLVEQYNEIAELKEKLYEDIRNTYLLKDIFEI